MTCLNKFLVGIRVKAAIKRVKGAITGISKISVLFEPAKKGLRISKSVSELVKLLVLRHLLNVTIANALATLFTIIPYKKF